ncbi:MAG: hypothetical protein AB1758_25620 [Candidatus Eremiobacterota bacterium]
MQLRPDVLERMVHAVERVRQRLLRAAAALDRAGVPYAVVGGNAVAAWVAQVDEGAVRNTQDVDILLRRGDLEAARVALSAAGFHYRHAKGLDMFLETPQSKARDGIHLVFAEERVYPGDPEPAPSVGESVRMADFTAVSLEGLVRMKLNSFRLKDQVHLQDMIEVGLLDASWLDRLPGILADRLKGLMDDPGR